MFCGLDVAWISVHIGGIKWILLSVNPHQPMILMTEASSNLDCLAVGWDDRVEDSLIPFLVQIIHYR